MLKTSNSSVVVIIFLNKYSGQFYAFKLVHKIYQNNIVW